MYGMSSNNISTWSDISTGQRMQILLLHGKQKVFAECDWLRPSFVPSSSLTERALGQTNSCQHDQREVCCRRVHAYIYIYIYYIYMRIYIYIPVCPAAAGMCVDYRQHCSCKASSLTAGCSWPSRLLALVPRTMLVVCLHLFALTHSVQHSAEQSDRGMCLLLTLLGIYWSEDEVT